jgi:hypothetical protein
LHIADANADALPPNAHSGPATEEKLQSRHFSGIFKLNLVWIRAGIVTQFGTRTRQTENTSNFKLGNFRNLGVSEMHL